MQKKKGISLIVLVITIIVMIILAASVVITLSNSGVISKSKNAVDSSNDVMVKERLQLAWAEAYENGNTGLEKLVAGVEREKEKLQEDGVDISQYSIEVTLKGVDVKKQTTSTEIKKQTTSIETKAWTLTDNDSSNSITVGDLITSNKKTTEQFYVIGVEGNAVKMLAKYNLKSDGSEQDTTGENNTSEFSTTAYWSGISGITYPYNLNNVPNNLPSDSATVINKAKAYGTSLEVTGRLMTIEELVFALGGDITTSSTSACPSFINSQNYWIGSAHNTYSVFCVNGSYASLLNTSFYEMHYCGVRPVLEILASEIQ